MLQVQLSVLYLFFNPIDSIVNGKIGMACEQKVEENTRVILRTVISLLSVIIYYYYL